jgi:hypothetical protein
MGGRAPPVAALVGSSPYLWQALQFPLATMSAAGAGCGRFAVTR